MARMKRKAKAKQNVVELKQKKKKLDNFVTGNIKTPDIFILRASKYFSSPELDVHISFIDYNGKLD
jgi:hypothetical protein